MFQVPCGYPFRTVGQVDAAINAGRWFKSIQEKREAFREMYPTSDEEEGRF